MRVFVKVLPFILCLSLLLSACSGDDVFPPDESFSPEDSLPPEETITPPGDVTNDLEETIQKTHVVVAGVAVMLTGADGTERQVNIAEEIIKLLPEDVKAKYEFTVNSYLASDHIWESYDAENYSLVRRPDIIIGAEAADLRSNYRGRAQRGKYADITSYFNEEASQGDFYTPVIESGVFDGKQLTVPLAFTPNNLVSASKKKLDASGMSVPYASMNEFVTDIMDRGYTGDNACVFAPLSPWLVEGMARELWSSDVNCGELTAERIIDELQTLQTLLSNTVMLDEAAVNPPMVYSNGIFYDYEFYQMWWELADECAKSDRRVFSPPMEDSIFPWQNPEESAWIEAALDSGDYSYYFAWPKFFGNAGLTAVPKLVAVIDQESEAVEAGYELIKAALSEEFQYGVLCELLGMNGNEYLPVSKTAFNRYTDVEDPNVVARYEKICGDILGAEDDRLEEYVKPMLESYRQAINSMSAALVNIHRSDVTDLAYGPIEMYWKGEITIDEAAERIHRAVA